MSIPQADVVNISTWAADKHVCTCAQFMYDVIAIQAVYEVVVVVSNQHVVVDACDDVLCRFDAVTLSVGVSTLTACQVHVNTNHVVTVARILQRVAARSTVNDVTSCSSIDDVITPSR